MEVLGRLNSLGGLMVTPEEVDRYVGSLPEVKRKR
jgi:hypothetical protein